MHLDPRLRATAGTIAAVGLIAALAAGGSSAGAAQTTAAGCKPAQNIEAIIDDSGSMDSTDPAKFRTTLLDAFTALGGNQGKVLGGVEFGDTANDLFAPATIPGVVPAMDASFALVNADNGTTDYNLAFAQAATANPNADARIFLSDGEHNEGAYNNGHNSPRLKTDTVGFGSADPTLLTQIATDTGGRAFNVTDSSQVPAVAAGITADLNCKAPPVVFTDTFNRQGQQFTHQFKAKGGSADLLLTWPTVGTVLDVLKVTQPRVGKAVAQTAGVKVQKKRGTTFVTVHLKKLKKGVKVKFRVKATTLTAPTAGTTSVIR